MVSDADPGVRLIESLANTAGAETGADLLGTREEASGWLRAAGLLPDEGRLSNSEHAALLRLRESIAGVLAAHADGREDADAAARLTRALADGRLVLTVDPASSVRLASAARSSYPSMVAAVAVAVAEAAASGAWLRLKACPAPGCGRAFCDDSGSGHCSAHDGGHPAG